MNIDKVKSELIEYINNCGTQVLSRELISIVEQESVAISYYCMSDVYELMESGERKFEQELTSSQEQTFMSAVQRDFPDNWEDFQETIGYVANKMNFEIVDGIA